MEYAEILESYDAYTERAKALVEEGKTLFPYADYGAAVFGAHVLTLPPSEEDGGTKSLEAKRTAIEALKAAAPVVVWRKFAAPLTPSRTVLSGLPELVAAVEGREGVLHYQDGDYISSVDYSRSDSGVSDIRSVPHSALAGLGHQVMSSVVMQWTSLDWWFVLGIKQRPPLPSQAVRALMGGP